MLVLLVGVLISAQFLRADSWFPLGSLGQYAYARDPNGDVINTYMMGTTTTGEHVRVGLTPASAGISRVEFEVQLPEIQEDPDLLGDILEVWEANHPPYELVSVTVYKNHSPMSGGALAGEPYDVAVLTWATE